MVWRLVSRCDTEKTKNVQERGPSVAVILRLSSVLKEFAPGHHPGWGDILEEGKKKPKSRTTSEDEKIHDFGRRMTYISSGSFLTLQLPQPEFLVSLFPSCAGWLWQELMTYLEGSKLLVYTRYSQIVKCIYASHLASIFDGSWYITAH